MLIYHTNRETLRRIFSETIFRCAWCGNWEVDGVWTNKLPEGSKAPSNPSDGICPTCEKEYIPKYKKEIEQMNKTNPPKF